ncbi:MAG: hypothetical protein AAGA03_18680, partial [Planctomycetota bacterium]
MYRFSIRTISFLTLAIAFGLAFFRQADDQSTAPHGLLGTLLGSLTFVLGFGLVQQIIRPPEPRAVVDVTYLQAILRKLVLGLMLTGLVTGMLGTYRFGIWSYEADPSRFSNSDALEVGYPLWHFSLMLAALTSPWMSRPHFSQPFARGPFAMVCQWATSIGLLLYLMFVACKEMTVLMLVDVAINGVQIGMHQGPAVQTPAYQDWFGRTPGQWRSFVDWQCLTWPPLLAALMLLLWRQNRRPALWRVLILALALPGFINFARLASGELVLLFPEFANNYVAPSLVHIFTNMLLAFLVVLFVATRSESSFPAAATSVEQPRQYLYTSDHPLVGVTLMAIGFLHSIQLYRDMEGVSFGAFDWWSLATYLEAPEYLYGALMLPLGLQWLWRRFRVGST